MGLFIYFKRLFLSLYMSFWGLLGNMVFWKRGEGAGCTLLAVHRGRLKVLLHQPLVGTKKSTLVDFGGGAHPSESLVETAARETIEETHHMNLLFAEAPLESYDFSWLETKRDNPNEIADWMMKIDPTFKLETFSFQHRYVSFLVLVDYVSPEIIESFYRYQQDYQREHQQQQQSNKKPEKEKRFVWVDFCDLSSLPLFPRIHFLSSVHLPPSLLKYGKKEEHF